MPQKQDGEQEGVSVISIYSGSLEDNESQVMAANGNDSSFDKDTDTTRLQTVSLYGDDQSSVSLNGDGVPQIEVDLAMFHSEKIGEQLHQGTHDQLPNVEEYKASSGHGTPIHSPTDPKEEAWPFDEDHTTITRRCGKSKIILLLCILIVVSSLVISMILFLPQRNRTDDVIQFLVDNGISKLEALEISGSPQNKAAKWIADIDRRQVSISTGGEFLDRYVMALLFYAFFGDVTWPNNLNFLSKEHVCEWYKSKRNPSGRDVPAGVIACETIDDGERVPVGIALAFHGLNGRIPDEIRYLESLEILVLQYNPALGGDLPSAIGTLKDLRILSIEHCSLTGNVPDWIGNMTSLTSLGLSNNRLTGAVPSSIRKLTNLVSLQLDDNFLSGDLELFGALSNLNFLYLDNNRFEGKLTDSLLLEWGAMKELDLSENMLTSTIPEDTFSHSTLEVLDLHANRFTGTLPVVKVEKNERLKFLALQENQLNYEIPTSIAYLRSLQYLDLSMNDFWSTIPPSIEEMTNLQYLFLGENPIRPGEFPEFLKSLKSLQELSLKDIGMRGTIPGGIGYFTSLKYLDLGENDLSGSLPDTLGLLSNLDHLLLRRNQLTGELPDELDLLSNLDVFLIEGNNFTGTADAICDAKSTDFAYFSSDCGGDQPSFICECCDVCCEGGDLTCNDIGWKGNINPQWEADFKRQNYEYGEGILFSTP